MYFKTNDLIKKVKHETALIKKVRIVNLIYFEKTKLPFYLERTSYAKSLWLKVAWLKVITEWTILKYTPLLNCNIYFRPTYNLLSSESLKFLISFLFLSVSDSLTFLRTLGYKRHEVFTDLVCLSSRVSYPRLLISLLGSRK